MTKPFNIVLALALLTTSASAEWVNAPPPNSNFGEGHYRECFDGAARAKALAQVKAKIENAANKEARTLAELELTLMLGMLQTCPTMYHDAPGR